MTDTPEPTAQDLQNAAIRDTIARKQAEEYGQCLRWAMGAFGPGWEPSCRHMLISKEEEEKHRRTGEPAIPTVTVYTAKHRDGRRRHFMVEEGKVREVESYEAGFGPMLLEPDTNRTIEVAGKQVHPHKYSLCWAGYELYRPKSPAQLASLRTSRERGQVEREAEKNPLFADQIKAEGPAPKKGRG